MHKTVSMLLHMKAILVLVLMSLYSTGCVPLILGIVIDNHSQRVHQDRNKSIEYSHQENDKSIEYQHEEHMRQLDIENGLADKVATPVPASSSTSDIVIDNPFER